ncbi:MAG TPA: DUF3322 domain-containing protein [Streptosporangiaceae bacterium]|nr:DUF3322 domain-containing protein [Streptosporangiaceae bacterium]
MAAPVASRPPWTTPADVVARLRRQWEAGVFLTSFASGEPFSPFAIPLRGPGAREISDSFAAAAAWAAQWRRAETPLRVEQARVGGRAFGSNAVPRRVWVESYEQLWDVLRVGATVRRFGELTDVTRERCPRLVPWMRAHPMRVVRLDSQWPDIVATVRWIDERQRPGMYLRQVDVPGVDTKFIEQHRGVLADLLDLQLAADRIDAGVPRPDFAGRYRFRKKPLYVRFRLPGEGQRFGSVACSEFSLRTDEFTSCPSGITSVLVVENEITYLALPVPAGAMAVFGGGYAVSALESLPWLARTDLVYWGDIDTHGFAILNRLRGCYRQARSLLMDRETLLAHRTQWVREPNPFAGQLDLLTGQEAALYRELLDNALGQSVRLEQERIRFGLVEQALCQLLRGQCAETEN